MPQLPATVTLLCSPMRRKSTWAGRLVTGWNCTSFCAIRSGAFDRDVDAFFAPVEKFSLETWREIMAVNLDGMFNVAQAFGGRMAERGYGAIVQTASIYGLMAPDRQFRRNRKLRQLMRRRRA